MRSRIPHERSTATSRAERSWRGRPRRARPGTPLAWLPDAPLPADLAWAAASPTIAVAFARAAASFEHAAEVTITADVRALVRDRVDAWRGEDPGLGRRWVEDAITDVVTASR